MALIVQRKKITTKLFATFFVVFLLSQGLIVQNANAVVGVSDRVSYQGRLTDSSGNPLTNTYCVRYSVYDAYSGGTKLWPAGVPVATTTAVINGSGGTIPQWPRRPCPSSYRSRLRAGAGRPT